jgi:hypothetical protein
VAIVTDFVWMQHREHKGKGRFAAGAVELWQHAGWELCDAPPEPDPTRDPSLDNPGTRKAPPATVAALTPADSKPKAAKAAPHPNATGDLTDG